MNFIEDTKSIEFHPELVGIPESLNSSKSLSVGEDIDELISSLFLNDNTKQVLNNNKYQSTEDRKQVLVVTPEKPVAPKLLKPLPNSATVSPYEKYLERLRLTSPLARAVLFADKSP